jgi:hypothetical protein
MESLARLVAIILGGALSAGIIAIVLWRKPPRNPTVRAALIVLMLPVMFIGMRLATLSVGIGVRVMGIGISAAAILAVRSMLTKKNLH